LHHRRSPPQDLHQTTAVSYDRQILLQPDFETAFCETSAECFAQGSDGLVRDSELLYRSWAFDVRTIKRRVHMWQGMDDRLVPASINKQVADQMPGAVWHPVEGAGHLWLSVQRTNCSESRPRNSARWPKIGKTQREKRRRATTTMKKAIANTKRQEKLAGRKGLRLSLAAHRYENQGTGDWQGRTLAWLRISQQAVRPGSGALVAMIDTSPGRFLAVAPFKVHLKLSPSTAPPSRPFPGSHCA
jgi:hypothetical protein